MVITHGENTPLYSMVKEWDAEFKCGRNSQKDYTSQRRPVTVNTQETIAMIHDIIMAEDYIATELGIIQDLLHVVIHNKLPRCQHVVSQISLTWLKWTRLNTSRENLVIF